MTDKFQNSNTFFNSPTPAPHSRYRGILEQNLRLLLLVTSVEQRESNKKMERSLESLMLCESNKRNRQNCWNLEFGWSSNQWIAVKSLGSKKGGYKSNCCWRSKLLMEFHDCFLQSLGEGPAKTLPRSWSWRNYMCSICVFGISRVILPVVVMDCFASRAEPRGMDTSWIRDSGSVLPWNMRWSVFDIVDKDFDLLTHDV